MRLFKNSARNRYFRKKCQSNCKKKRNETHDILFMFLQKSTYLSKAQLRYKRLKNIQPKLRHPLLEWSWVIIIKIPKCDKQAKQRDGSFQGDNNLFALSSNWYNRNFVFTPQCTFSFCNSIAIHILETNLIIAELKFIKKYFSKLYFLLVRGMC